MENKKLSEQESIDLILNMISDVKGNLHNERGNAMLVWGYATAIFGIGLGLAYIWLQTPVVWIAWWAMPIIANGILRQQVKKESEASGYFNKMIGVLWKIIFYAMIATVLSFLLSPGLYMLIQAMIIMYIGIGCAVTGLILRFRPLIFGGIANFILFAVCYRLDIEYQTFIIALAAVASLIIPGHLLNKVDR